MNPNLAKEGEPYRFRPGQSGNPAGRPKRQPITRALELVARTRVPEGPKAGRRWWTAMALGLAEAAARGDATAFKEYRNTIQGPPDGERDSGPPQILVQIIDLAPATQVESAPRVLEAQIVDVGK